MKKLPDAWLVIRQLDRKLQNLSTLKDSPPRGGWINLIRLTLGMSCRQYGNKLSITPQRQRDIERYEAEGTITLKTFSDKNEKIIQFVSFLLDF